MVGNQQDTSKRNMDTSATTRSATAPAQTPPTTATDIPSFDKLVKAKGTQGSCGGLQKPQLQPPSDKAGRSSKPSPSGAINNAPETVSTEKRTNKEDNGDFGTPEQILLPDDFEVRKDDSSFSSMDEYGKERVKEKKSDQAKTSSVSPCERVKDEDRKRADANKKETFRIPRIPIAGPVARTTIFAVPSNPFVSPFKPSSRRNACKPASGHALVDPEVSPFVSAGVIMEKGKAENASGDREQLTYGEKRLLDNGKELTISDVYEKKKNITEEVRQNAPENAEKRRKKAIRKAWKDAEIRDFNADKIETWKERGGPPRPAMVSSEKKHVPHTGTVGWTSRINFHDQRARRQSFDTRGRNDECADGRNYMLRHTPYRTERPYSYLGGRDDFNAPHVPHRHGNRTPPLNYRRRSRSPSQAAAPRRHTPPPPNYRRRSRSPLRQTAAPRHHTTPPPSYRRRSRSPLCQTAAARRPTPPPHIYRRQSLSPPRRLTPPPANHRHRPQYCDKERSPRHRLAPPNDYRRRSLSPSHRRAPPRRLTPPPINHRHRSRSPPPLSRRQRLLPVNHTPQTPLRYGLTPPPPYQGILAPSTLHGPLLDAKESHQYRYQSSRRITPSPPSPELVHRSDRRLTKNNFPEEEKRRDLGQTSAADRENHTQKGRIREGNCCCKHARRTSKRDYYSESESEDSEPSTRRPKRVRRRKRKRVEEEYSSSSDSEYEAKRRRKRRKKEKRSKREGRRLRHPTSSDCSSSSDVEFDRVREAQAMERKASINISRLERSKLVSARAMHRRYRRNKAERPINSVARLGKKNKLDPRRGDKAFARAFGPKETNLTDMEFKAARKVLATMMKQRGEEVDRIANDIVGKIMMPEWYNGAEPIQDIVNVFADVGNDGFLPFLFKLDDTKFKADHVWDTSLELLVTKFRELGMDNFAEVTIYIDNLFRRNEVAKGIQLARAAKLQLKALLEIFQTPAMHQYFGTVELEVAASYARRNEDLGNKAREEGGRRYK